jgi:hypothetical protein
LAFVDDFIFTGNDNEWMKLKIEEFRSIANTTEPNWNAGSILGVEIIRQRDEKILKCSMKSRIESLQEKFGTLGGKVSHIPMPGSGFLVNEEDYQSLQGWPKWQAVTSPIQRVFGSSWCINLDLRIKAWCYSTCFVSFLEYKVSENPSYENGKGSDFIFVSNKRPGIIIKYKANQSW